MKGIQLAPSPGDTEALAHAEEVQPGGVEDREVASASISMSITRPPLPSSTYLL